MRVYNLLKILSKKHKISLLSFIRSAGEQQYLSELSFCHRVDTVMRGGAWQAKYVLSSLTSSYPFLFSTYRNEGMRQKIRDVLETGSIDLVHIEPGYVWPSLPKISIPLVVSEHNIESAIYEEYVRRFPFPPLRPLLSADVWKLRVWERRTWRQASCVVGVSQEDAGVIERSTPATPVTVVPNGVDLVTFPFRPKRSMLDQPTFLFVGNFSWMQNRDAAAYLVRSVWPSIREQYPDATLRVVGRNASPALRHLITSKGAILLEEVEEVRNEFEKADILLAPIRIGGGTKFKILEAMAHGIAVVTTREGIKGLDVIDGKEVVLADTIGETVAQIMVLCQDESRRAELLSAARKKVEVAYSWEHIAQELARVWKTTHEKKH